MTEKTKLNPLKEDELDDFRDKISETVFIEFDILNKTYEKYFLDADDAKDDYSNFLIIADLRFIQNNWAFLLKAHENEHQLYNVDLSVIEIPKSKYTDENGDIINKVHDLNDSDKVNYCMNLLVNTKHAILELRNSKYFNNINNDEFILPINDIIIHIVKKIDEIMLRINANLNKL